MAGRIPIDANLKKTKVYIYVPFQSLKLFPTPTHARLYAENCINNFNPNINNCPKPPKLANFNANKALQKFIKNSNNPKI